MDNESYTVGDKTYNDMYPVIATGTRPESSVLPGPYTRIVGYYNSREEAQNEIDEHMRLFDPDPVDEYDICDCCEFPIEDDGWCDCFPDVH